MPSTVKVRIKGARNLGSHSSVTHSPSAHNISSFNQGINAFVSVTLGVGKHSSLVSSDEEISSLDYGFGSNNTSRRAYSARTKAKKSHHVWDEEFRFEVADDKLLQEEPLIFKVWATNASESGSGSSSDTSLGLVYVDLNPLLCTSYTGQEYDDEQFVLDAIDGWFPLYDTLKGVRGELGLSVKLNFFGDVNPVSF